jgi:hypothetical protein
MKKEKQSSAFTERQCPACAHKFKVGQEEKRIRCPHCREIVSAESVAERSLPTAPAGPKATEDWRQQCEILEQRFEALEREVKTYMNAAARAEGLLFAAQRRTDDRLTSAAPARPVKREEETAVVTNGNAHGKGSDPPPSPDGTDDAPPAVQKIESASITLLAGTEDLAMRRVARNLSEILSRAGWSVHESSNGSARCRNGLTLAAAPTLSRERLTTTFSALRNAGYSVTVQFDPRLRGDETLLMVGPGATGESVSKGAL